MKAQNDFMPSRRAKRYYIRKWVTSSDFAQVWSSILTVKLIEAEINPDSQVQRSRSSEPHVRFCLGKVDYKSKRANSSDKPSWLETFDLHILSEANELICSVMDGNVLLGRCKIQLEQIRQSEARYTHYELEDGAGKLLMLLSVSESIGLEAVRDLGLGDLDPDERNVIVDRYSLWRSFTNLKDVGYLSVKVFRAQGVAAADIGGKSDPFCVLQLVNARLRTHTEFRTLNPVWNKAFTFAVKDVHAVLEVEVYDEDQNEKTEFLGAVAIPLLDIKNGERKWFALKDRKLNKRAKGQILLEMEMFHNLFKSCIRTFNPAEEKYDYEDEKFKRTIFVEYVMRLRAFISVGMEMGQFVQNIFNWESTSMTVISFVVFELIVYCFEPYMVPTALAVGLVVGYVRCYYGRKPSVEEFCDDEVVKAEEEDKKSIKERLQTVQEVLSIVQRILGYLAALMESMRNTFNFTRPFLSFLALFVLIVIAFLLSNVSLRYLLMLWGLHKFTRKLRQPYAIPNNELLDFLSRVPCDPEKAAFRPFRPEDLPTELTMCPDPLKPRRSSPMPWKRSNAKQSAKSESASAFYVHTKSE